MKGSWKAHRHGNKYCSPACGRGCTWSEFQKATAAAISLAKRCGKDFKPFAYENLGWHYNAELTIPNTRVTLKVYETGLEYWTLLGEFGGEMHYTARGSKYKTPIAAIEAQLKIVRAHARDVNATLNAIEVAFASSAKNGVSRGEKRRPVKSVA